MNCCHTDEHKTDNPKHHKSGHLAHILLMILCCAVPALILFLLPTIGNLIPGSARIIASIAPFLCPVMMVAMIPMMLRGRNSESGAATKQIQAGDPEQQPHSEN
jgi:hypothetical protein